MKKSLISWKTPKKENSNKNFYFSILFIFISIFVNYVANADFMKCSIYNDDIHALDTQCKFPPYL